MSNLISIALVATGASPLHAHDCNHCRFLGHVLDHGASYDVPAVRDVYVCDTFADDETIILRFGSEGPEYSSYGLEFGRLVSEFDETVKGALTLLGLQPSV